MSAREFVTIADLAKIVHRDVSTLHKYLKKHHPAERVWFISRPSGQTVVGVSYAFAQKLAHDFTEGLHPVGKAAK